MPLATPTAPCAFPGSYHPMNSARCHDCPVNSYAGESGATTCQPCGDFAISLPSSSVCVCIAAYTPSAQVCVRCGDRYYKMSSGNQTCLSCPSGSFSNPAAAVGRGARPSTAVSVLQGTVSSTGRALPVHKSYTSSLPASILFLHEFEHMMSSYFIPLALYYSQ